MHRHRLHRKRDVFLRIGSAQGERFGQRHFVRHVTVQRVVRAGLVGQEIRDNSAPNEFRQHIRAVPNQANRDRVPRIEQLERLVE